MEIPVPSIETIKVGWDWILKNLQVWFQVLREPSEVLEKRDLDSTDTLIAAIQFAVFPVALASIVQLPLYLMTKDTAFGFVGYFVVCAVAYPTVVFICAASQRTGAVIFRGKGSLTACTISTLYATAFWPLVELVNYSELMNHRETYKKLYAGAPDSLTSGDVTALWIDVSVLAIITIYLISKFVPMTRVVHKVGRFRALMICLLTMIVATVLTNSVIQPIQKMLLFP